MSWGSTLTVVIPLVVLGYALWLILRMVRGRKTGKCGLGGCAGCPLHDGCHTAMGMKEKQKEQESGDERDA